MRLGLKVWLGIALGAAFAMFGAIGPAAADRPGTPTNVTAGDCGIVQNAETVCGTFYSASDEDVHFENQITLANEEPASGVGMTCPQQLQPTFACVLFSVKKEYQGVQFLVTNAKFDTMYCVRFRARRYSDQMVSELWSNSACVHTAPMPPIPAKPKIAFGFSGTIWSGGRQFPQSVTVAIPKVSQGWAASVSFDGGRTFCFSPSCWVAPVTAADPTSSNPTMNIVECMSNPAGKSCTSDVVSILTQTATSIDGALPIKITGGAPGQPPPPRPTSGFDGAWNVTTDQNTAFTLNMMLVHGAKMGGFVAPPNPADNINMYGKLVDPTHAQMNFTEPGHSLTGTLGITLTNGGTAFIAIAQYSNNTTSIWRGTKTTPPPAR